MKSVSFALRIITVAILIRFSETASLRKKVEKDHFQGFFYRLNAVLSPALLARDSNTTLLFPSFIFVKNLNNRLVG
jgi:hypothetical protein